MGSSPRISVSAEVLPAELTTAHVQAMIASIIRHHALGAPISAATLTRIRATLWAAAQTAQFLNSIAGHRLYAAYHLIALRGLRRGRRGSSDRHCVLDRCHDCAGDQADLEAAATALDTAVCGRSSS
jgi:hypothetical protein